MSGDLPPEIAERPLELVSDVLGVAEPIHKKRDHTVAAGRNKCRVRADIDCRDRGPDRDIRLLAEEEPVTDYPRRRLVPQVCRIWRGRVMVRRCEPAEVPLIRSRPRQLQRELDVARLDQVLLTLRPSPVRSHPAGLRLPKAWRQGDVGNSVQPAAALAGPVVRPGVGEADVERE